MEKENIVDLVGYRNPNDTTEAKVTPMSDELQQAIQSLIYRLRELGPLPNPN